jgi:DNA-binding response OmpR family regulator
LTRILIAEDEPRVASFVAKGLRAAGFSTSVAGDGQQAWSQAASGDYELLILDIGLPLVDGFTVLRRLRQGRHGLPIILLTGRDGIEDKVAGLEGGADDYVVKPFAFDELLARVRLRLRDPNTVEPMVLTAGTLSLDLRSRRASVRGCPVELSAREFVLAETFARHPDQVLTRQQILSRVWSVDFDLGSNVVDVYVRYLRGKLGRERIETVRGVGYRMVTTV